jgi:hypothetical protein
MHAPNAHATTRGTTTAGTFIRVPRRWLAIVPLLAAAACSDPITAPAGPASAAVQSSQGFERPSIERVSLRLDAEGPFRPGVPIKLRASARANLAAPDVKLEMIVFGADTIAGSGRPAGAGRRIASKSARLAQGDVVPFTASTSFDEPGYYQIAVRAVGRAAPAEEALRQKGHARARVNDFSVEVIDLVIDEAGGGVTSDWRTLAKAGARRQPKFGGLGPFRPLPVPANSSAAASGSSGQLPQSDLSRSSMAAPQGRLQVTYPAYDDAGVNQTYVESLQGAEVWVGCDDSYGRVISSNTYRADMSGEVFWNCAYSYTTMVEFHVSLISPYAVVNERGQPQPVATHLNIYANSSYIYTTINMQHGHASRVFRNLHFYAPIMASQFGRTRSAARVWVDPVYPGPTAYVSAIDSIRMYRSDIFGAFGTYSAVHEYAHAFHFMAIEPWGALDACPDPHYVNDPTGLGCAFREGFADFAAAWVAGTALDGTSFAPRLIEADRWLEPNRPAGAGSDYDGSIIEGAVAAFLFDMVDGTYTNDGVSGDDDTVEWPGSYIADLISTCYVDGTVTRVSGIDQFIYCAENNPQAYTANPFNSWRVYPGSTAIEYATEPAGWSPSKVRALWRWNLYNYGALP